MLLHLYCFSSHNRVLLVNTEFGKYIICADPHGEASKEGRAPNTAYRTNVLRTFYRKMVSTFIKNQPSTSAEKLDTRKNLIH